MRGQGPWRYGPAMDGRYLLDTCPDGCWVLWQRTDPSPRVVAEGRGHLRGRLVCWWRRLRAGQL